jgi:hypothetical protein
MISRPTRPESFGFSAVVVCVLAAALVAAGCDKVPLLAPTGSVITLFPSANTVPSNGEIEIVATVIEQGTAAPAPGNGTGTGGGPTSTSTTGSGTPVHNGTLVSFTTTIGRIEPSEARTQNGQVRVRFHAAVKAARRRSRRSRAGHPGESRTSAWARPRPSG